MGRTLIIWIAGLLAAGLFAATGAWLVTDHTRSSDELRRESDRLMANYVPYCDGKRMSPGDSCYVFGDADDPQSGTYQERRTKYNASVTPEKLDRRYTTWRYGGYGLLGVAGLLVVGLLVHMVVTAATGGGVVPVLAAVVTLALVGAGGFVAIRDTAGDEPAVWAVGSCVRQVSGPSTTPTPAPTGDGSSARVGSNTTAVLTTRLQAEKDRVFTLVGCDSTAEGTITALIPVPDAKDVVAAQKCPVTTDDIHWVPGESATPQLVCVRRLAGPHPGDPGGGNDIPAAGDCVTVGGSDASAVRNDRVAEVPCATKGWFAKILKVTPGYPTGNPACPEATVSRVAHPVTPSTVLCLGADRRGEMAIVGECFASPQYAYDAPPRTDCGGAVEYSIPYRIDSFVSVNGTCPDGKKPLAVTGYERGVCGGYQE